MAGIASWRRLAKLALVAGAVGTLSSAAQAGAQCTERAAGSEVRRSVGRAVRCNDRVLRAGPDVTCLTSPPPACVETLVGDAVALAYGANNPATAAIDTRTLRDQYYCQRQIGRAASHYVSTSLRYLLGGRTPADADARSLRQLDRIADRCAVSVALDASGAVIPAVGPQCAAALPPPGGLIDTAALRNCLHTLLRVWVERYGPNPQPLRPNIVFILTDDQRWDTTDATHSPDTMPIMPRTRAELADNGVEFTQAFMTTPVCCPSRSSILSGQYSHRSGVYKNGGNNGGADDFEDSESLGVWLQNAGYRTSLIGKYLNGYQQLWDDMTEPPYVPPGWTEWRGMKNVAFFDYVIIEPDGMGGYVEVPYGSAAEDYSTDVLREKAKTFISASVAMGQPFFLYLSFKAPHLPQIPAPRHDGMFQSIAPWRPPSYNEPDVSDKPTWLQNTPQMTPAEQADLDQVRIDQLEMLQAVDEAIGGSTAHGIVGIMEHIRTLGIADDTMVVFFSDNGWQWGEHRTRAKLKPYEESIRAPLLVHYPKLVPLPRMEARFALNIDFAPTFTELAGASAPIPQDGQSLVRVLDGTAPAWRTDFLTEGWPNNRIWASVREAAWKYNELPVTPGDPMTAFELELYDLDNDPYEETNVAAAPQHAARIAAMAARLRQLRPNWPVDSDPMGPDPEEDE
jgi:arylsulfatase A-like enzyme